MEEVNFRRSLLKEKRNLVNIQRKVTSGTKGGVNETVEERLG